MFVYKHFFKFYTCLLLYFVIDVFVNKTIFCNTFCVLFLYLYLNHKKMFVFYYALLLLALDCPISNQDMYHVTGH